jgi:hypothetical protein
MLVLLGYFVIAVGAGVAASGIIGYIVASILIRRYEKADPPLKIPSTSATTIQPSLIHPLPCQLQPMCLSFLHRPEYLALNPCNLDERASQTVRSQAQAILFYAFDVIIHRGHRLIHVPARDQT